jgi:kelch-like protein 10
MEAGEGHAPASDATSLPRKRVKRNKKNSRTNSAKVPFPKVWNKLRLRRQLCDGTIYSIDGKTFHIHRIILCAASPFFKSSFIKNPKEGERETNELKLDVQGHIIDLILDHAYTGRCKVTSENVEHLLLAADKYGIVSVLHQCCQHLLENLKPENCIRIFNLARRYSLRDLEDRRRKYICHNFEQIFRNNPEFKDLSGEELGEILRDDELNVENEGLVFEAAIKWTNADLRAREQYLRTLIQCARCGLMCVSFFTCVMNNELIFSSPELQKALYSASVFLTEQRPDQEYDRALNDLIARPRIPYEILFAFGGWSDVSPTKVIETYDVRADKWVMSKNNCERALAYHGVCALDNLIYIVGGYDGTDYLNTVQRYDPLTKNWQDCACMYQSRCYVSVCSQDGKIYALGGFNGITRTNSGETYNSGLNQWEMIPAMHCKRSDASAASLNGKIYIVGGFDGEDVLNSAERFDPDTKEWTFIPHMESPRSGVNLVAYNDSLYAIGGFNAFFRLSSVERYSPFSLSNWQQVSEMCIPRSNFAAVVLDGKIFVFGGFDGATVIADAEYFDEETGEWYEASIMNVQRSALSACVLSGLPNAREYCYTAGVEGTYEEIPNGSSGA